MNHCVTCGAPADAPPLPAPPPYPYPYPYPPGAPAATIAAPARRTYRQRSRDTGLVAAIAVAAVLFSLTVGPWALFTAQMPDCQPLTRCNFGVLDNVSIVANLLFLAAWAIGIIGVCRGAVQRKPKWPWALGGLALIVVSTLVAVIGLRIGIDPSV